jgi:glycerol-3-phosphate dehydrogenase
MYDVAVIGAGIVGLSIARELARYNVRALVIEKCSDVANGTTKANSAIVHAGYDAKPGSLMARFNAKGNPMFDKICEELDVPFKRTGSLVLAFCQEDMDTLQKLYERGIKNGIPGMELLTREKLKSMEANISSEAFGALYAKTAGIVGTWDLAVAMAENAVENSVELYLDCEVESMEKQGDAYTVNCKNEKCFRARFVVNSAGVYADKINEMVASPSFKINPRRGQYFVMDKSSGGMVKNVVFQCPSKMGKGVVVVPTVGGNLLVGPDAEDIEDRGDTSTTSKGLEYIRSMGGKSCPNLSYESVITTFSGLRAESDTGDFIIEESSQSKGFINVAGIKSPGLSSAPAIAEYVIDLLRKAGCCLEEKDDFNPIRKQLRFSELNESEQRELIKHDPRYGRVICRCENITEGEIVDAIKRSVGARTVDGVKKRCRPGMGRCQGGFCGPRVQEILARELGKDMSEIVKDGKESYILSGSTKE